jgi:hypothetical protein
MMNMKMILLAVMMNCPGIPPVVFGFVVILMMLNMYMLLSMPNHKLCPDFFPNAMLLLLFVLVEIACWNSCYAAVMMSNCPAVQT